MQKTRTVLLGALSLAVVLILATGCFRPAAPDVAVTSSGGPRGATPDASAIEATAMENSTRAARVAQTETAAAAPAGGEEGELAETSTDVPATSTPGVATVAPEPATAVPEAATPTPTVSSPQPTPTVAPSGQTTYVVQSGDTLFSIALRYGTTMDAIAQASGIADVSQIYVGQELIIPAAGQPPQPAPGGTTYIVQPGDRLFRIALRYGLSWTQLAAYNGITDPDSIYPGQVLQIPPH